MHIGPKSNSSLGQMTYAVGPASLTSSRPPVHTLIPSIQKVFVSFVIGGWTAAQGSVKVIVVPRPLRPSR